MVDADASSDIIITPSMLQSESESEVKEIKKESVIPLIGLNAKIEIVEETEHEITYLVKVQKR
jgi:hypothetical protein